MPTRRRDRAWLLSIVLVVAAAFVGAYVVWNPGEDAPASASVQLASVESGCDDWAASGTPARPPEAWCSEMVDWMSGRTGPAMMGPHMWAGPDQMRAACRQWTESSDAEPGDRAGSACDDMVAWMDAHSTAGGWGTWPMHDR